jgi:hypothetical protein
MRKLKFNMFATAASIDNVSNAISVEIPEEMSFVALQLLFAVGVVVPLLKLSAVVSSVISWVSGNRISGSNHGIETRGLISIYI